MASLVLFSLSVVSQADAANPQPYTPAITPTGSGELDAALASSSLLVSLNDSAPAPPFGLIERARGDVQRLVTALNSFGYYQPVVSIMIADHDLDDEELPALLDQTPEGTRVDVTVRIEKGPLYLLRTIRLEGDPPPYARAQLHLLSGQPAVATDILASQARLLTALQEDAHAFADVQTPVAVADDEQHVVDVTFTVHSGPQLEIGKIAFEGLMRTNESHLRKVLTIHTGDRYQPSAIEAARQALVATGVFARVSVHAGQAADQDGRIPLTFDVQERPLRAVKLDGAYSTDLGVTFSGGWSHRNLFGNAEQVNLLAAATGLGGNATKGVGYQLSGQYIKPSFLRIDQQLKFDLSVVKQSLQAYNQRAETAAVTLQRKLSLFWTVSAGLSVTHDDVGQKGIDRTYQLLSLPLTATYDSTRLTDPLLDPTHGLRASFVATPIEAFGSRSTPIVVLQASGSGYLDVSHDGRSVVALRALVGSVLGASNLDLPPDQRLYAGGSPTVRGYRYQSIGPLFSDGDPIGGTTVDAATIELRQRLFGNFGAALFVDGGQASAKGSPFTGTFRFGTGAGLRYYTAIGAVRLDVAVPLNRTPQGDSFEIYVGLGQAF